MAGRGRGRGRGMSFDYSQLGLMPGETLPGPMLQPPPTYPPMERKPAPLILGPENEYMVALKRDYVEFLKDSLSFIQNDEPASVVQRFSDKYSSYLANKTSTNWQNKFLWQRFPAELRPKTSTSGKKRKSEAPRADGSSKKVHVDITKKLDELAKEEHTDDEAEHIKQEQEDEEEKDEENEENEEVEDLDEEMDDGTDYVNNYFDNGEGFEDEDDMDDGPVF